MSAAARRRGAKTRLLGVIILFLGLLNAMLSWRGGFALNAGPIVLIGLGLFVYALGAIRRTESRDPDSEGSTLQRRAP